MHLIRTLRFYMKRLGLLGCLKYLFAKVSHTSFDSYLFMQQRYYSKLSTDKYQKELGEWYYYRTGRKPDCIKHPVLFNDKIQWMKLNDNNDLKQICSDKLRVRDYIENLNISGLRLIPLIGSWEKVEDIDFEHLPNSFVLKQNAACKMNLIVTDKRTINVEKIRNKLKIWLNRTYGYLGMEVQYLHIPKYIIAEQYMQEMSGNLYDYKFFCFDGVPQYVEVIGDRNIEEKTGYSSFFDTEWNAVEFRTLTYPPFERKLEKPQNFEKMLEIAKQLSTPFKFVRVDLYNIDGQIYFGELSFTPTNGVSVWSSEIAEKNLGSLIALEGVTNESSNS